MFASGYDGIKKEKRERPTCSQLFTREKQYLNMGYKLMFALAPTIYNGLSCHIHLIIRLRRLKTAESKLEVMSLLMCREKALLGSDNKGNLMRRYYV